MPPRVVDDVFRRFDTQNAAPGQAAPDGVIDSVPRRAKRLDHSKTIPTTTDIPGPLRTYVGFSTYLAGAQIP